MAEPYFSLPHPAGTWMKLDLIGAVRMGLVEIICVFFFVDLFDNVGTLVGVCEQGNFFGRANCRARAAPCSPTPWARCLARQREHQP